jgi:pyruvate dehydrogenase E2 component (dihydrolipoamide acetyltransferase)
MNIEVRLPEISENVESGDVIKVLVSVGDVVEVDQSLVELETDKAVLEVPSPQKGTVSQILVKAGDTVAIGQVLLRIETSENEAAQVRLEAAGQSPERNEVPGAATHRAETPGPSAPPESALRRPAAPESSRGAAEVPAAPRERPPEHALPPLASPAVRRLARELGVDLRKVRGSGDGGRILQEDLKAFARQAVEEVPPFPNVAQPPSAAEPTRWGPIVREPMSKVRQITARTMTQAWTTIPHVTQYDKADITRIDAALKKYGPRSEKAGAKLTITAVLLKTAASALRVFPQFNASIDVEKQEIIYKHYVHIGVAVDTDRGLLVPVIRNVDQKNIAALSVELGMIAEKARARKLTPEEFEGGTFTVSNLGGIGGVGFSPIVYPPQSAILGVSRARMEPVLMDERFQPRLMLPLCVSYDHRIIDGADGARFLRWIVEALEEPILLSLEG